MTTFGETHDALNDLAETGGELSVRHTTGSDLKRSVDTLKAAEPRPRDTAANAMTKVIDRLDSIATHKLRDRKLVPGRYVLSDPQVGSGDWREKAKALVRRAARAALRSAIEDLRRIAAWLSS